VSLAHRGVLFLDEFPEFGRSVLESLRQPMEDRTVTIVRVASAVKYPADFLLVAAANPCPCGYLGSQTRGCVCPPYAIQKYRSKISGPILDRIDLQIEVPALRFDEITQDSIAVEPSSAIRDRVKAARDRQKKRLSSFGLTQNNQMTPRHIKTLCALEREGKNVLRQAIQRWGLSARAYDRILKVSRTIADLEGREQISTAHVAEAVGYRILDREASEGQELSIST
jgi:magnesium chelatase family protein